MRVLLLLLDNLLSSSGSARKARLTAALAARGACRPTWLLSDGPKLHSVPLTPERILQPDCCSPLQTHVMQSGSARNHSSSTSSRSSHSR